MKAFMRVISIFALIATITPPILFLAGHSELATVKLTMLIATVAWFVTATIASQGGDNKPAPQAEQ